MSDAQRVRVVTTEQIVRVFPTGRPGRDGTDGAAGGSIAPIDFAYGEAPHDVFTATGDGRVVLARVGITETFDGAGAAISVGTTANHSALLADTVIDPTELGDFEGIPDFDLAEGESIQIFITAGVGATQGAGFLFLEFVPTT